MKILHISHNLRGGAGKNLQRHHEALLKSGVKSRILIGETIEGSQRIQSLGANAWLETESDKRLEEVGRKLEPRIGDSRLLNRKFRNLQTHPWARWADLVEFRQVHGGGHRSYLPLEAIGNVTRERPVVWRLSDMWAFTGFCAYSHSCERWKTGCGKCPQLFDTGRSRAELRAPKHDSSWLQWKRKLNAYGGSSNLTVVSPSAWMNDLVGESILGRNRRRVIPIGVEESVYQQNRVKCREKLGLEVDATALLAILPNPSNYRKGYDLAMEALSRLKDCPPNLALVVVSAKPIDQTLLSVPTLELSYRSGDEEMAEVYAACDILLFSSRADNSSQVLVEAGMSGLAVVAFDTAGNPEYLSEAGRECMAPLEDTEKMAKAIESLISDEEKLRKAQASTRIEITERFRQQRQTEAFLALYRELVES